MARNRLKVTIIIATVVMLVAGIAAVYSRSHNPLRAQVRKILLRDMVGSGGKWDDGVNALWALGPDIIPCLAEEAVRQDSFLSKHYAQTWRKSPAWLKKHLPKPTNPAELREAAMHALAEFGPLAARRAAPWLIPEMSKKEFWCQSDHISLAHWLAPDSKAASAAFEYGLANTDTNWPTPDYFVGGTGGSFGPRGPKVVPLLTNLLHYPGIAFQVAVALGSMGSNAAPAIPALIQTIDMGAAGFTNAGDLHDHMFVAIYNPYNGRRATVAVYDSIMDNNRANAAYALGHIGVATPEACAALARAWNFPDPEVRRAAAQAVTLLRSPMTNELPALLTGLKDPDNSALDSKLQALRELGPGARDALVTLRELTDTNVVLSLVTNKDANVSGWTIPDLSVSAKTAICSIAPAEGRAYLPDIADQIGRRWEPVEFLAKKSALSNDIVRTVEPMLDESNALRSCAAAYIILSHEPGNLKALALLRKNRSTGEINHRLLAGRLLFESIGETNELCAIITEAFKDPRSFVGQNACEIAAKMGTNALPALPAIKAALWHKDKFVREHAGVLILKLAPQELPINELK